MSIQNCHNIRAVRDLALRQLPRPVLGYLEGGADDEWSLRNNQAAFERYQFTPRSLVDVTSVDLRAKILKCDLAMPLLLSPVAGLTLFHPGKELAVVRAAKDAGVLACVSNMANTSIEDIARAGCGPNMFQVYFHRDTGLTDELVGRCKAVGIHALCLTVDAPVGGNRERDRLTRMTLPPALRWRNALSFARRPAWSVRFFFRTRFRFENMVARHRATSVAEHIDQTFDRSATWHRVARIAKLWDGPLVLKGILTASDACRAKDAGATAIMVSNHGGRQLDCTPAPIDCVARIRDRVGDSLQLIVDGGIRRSSDIVKALAMGADACAIGRPYIYGLAIGGQAGVGHVLGLIRHGLERDLALLGCRSIAEIDRTVVLKC